MKKRLEKLSVTIGIPAFNEASNIGLLLHALKNQKTRTFILDSVIVISDGSNDGTVLEANKVLWKKLKVLENKLRLGLNPTENRIIKESKSDILVLLDADILPQKTDFVEKLIAPFYKDSNLGVAGADTTSLAGVGFIESILAKSHSFKKQIYRQINNGKNIYNCHGRARAFSKRFYSILQFPKNCPEDGYSYLYCIKNNFNFKYVSNATVIFRSPTNIGDQTKQSKRFKGGQRILRRYFDNSLIEQSFDIPVSLIIKSVLSFFKRDTLAALTYFALIFYIRFLNKIPTTHQIKYETSYSTKKLSLKKGLV